MKFGKVSNPADVDFTLPEDHPGTATVLASGEKPEIPKLYVGCAKWNRTDLKGFYPRGTKDELTYYSSQFNSIELNATFYRIFPPEVFASWYAKTPPDFRFFPKVFQGVSHWKRLADFEAYWKHFLINAANLKEKAAMYFLQLHSNFGPKNWERLIPFFEAIPKGVRIAIEFRHADWFQDESIANKLYALLEQYKITHIIVDTAGRRDLLHMRLTTPYAFIRYNGANHPSDFNRLDDWINRLETWIAQGLEEIYFFIHQNIEQDSPWLAAYFIRAANERFGTTLPVPTSINPKSS